jgi:hypothetical protein
MLEQNGFLSADSQDLDEIKTKISTLIEHWKTTGLPDLERPSHMTVEVAVHQLMNIRNSLIKSQ